MAQTAPGPAISTPVATRRVTGNDLLMLSVVIIWGFNFSIVKIAFASFTPLAFNAARFVLATLTMLAILRLRGESLAFPRHDLLKLVLLGLTGHTIYQWVFIKGLALTSAGNTSLLMATSPVFVAIYGHLLGVERNTRRIWAGIALSFCGALLLIAGSPAGIRFGSGATLGDLLVLCAAMMWAIYTTLSKPMLGRYSPTQLTTLSMITGTPPLILLSMGELGAQNWGAIAPGHWAALFYSAMLSIVVSYILWNVSLQRVGNARTAIYSNVTPIVANVAAWLLLGTRPAPLQGVGAVVVLAGLLLARRQRSRPAEQVTGKGDAYGQ